MSLHLNDNMLRSCYKFLCSTQPFDKWNMPNADDIVFKVVRSPLNYGWHTVKGRRNRKRMQKHLIAVSGKVVGHITTLLETMAHEMVHLYIEHHHIEPKNYGEHSLAFRRLAEIVCKHHGFDPKRF